MNDDKIVYLPVYYVKRGSLSIFTLFYGLLRVIRIGVIGVVTICGVPILAWQPFPEWMK